MNEWHHQSSKRNKWQIKTHNYQYQWFIIVSSRTSAFSVRLFCFHQKVLTLQMLLVYSFFFLLYLAAPHSLFISYSRKFPSRLSWMFYFHVYWSYLLSEWSVLLVRTSSKMMRTELKIAPIEIMHKNTMCQVNYHWNVPVFTRI